MNKIFKNEKLMYMLAGAAAIVVGKKIVTAETTRKAAVNSIAKGMKIRDDAKCVFQNMKDEAEDICYDAKLKAEGGDCETAEK